MVSFLDQAKTHMDRREFIKAIESVMQHLNSDFHDEVAIFMMGAAYLALGQNGMAAVLNRQAIEIRNRKGGNFPEAIANLAACFKNEHKPEAAAELWEMAIGIETDDAEKARFWSNIGGCHVNRGMPEKAIECYEKALALRPDLHRARYNRSFALLEMGKWREGWEAFHFGLKTGDRKPRKYGRGDLGAVPEWDGSGGQTVLVWGEQGIGDEILYASCIPDLVKVSKHVIFDCHPRLIELFKRSFPTVEVYGTRKTQSEIPWLEKVAPDAAVCISTLPMFFRNAAEDFPGTPFLAPARETQLVARRPRIGIAWTGGSKSTNTHLRSIPLREWLPVLKSVDADWVSLEYPETAAKDVCALEEETGVRITHFPGKVQCKDYDKTATFVAGLDLVITVCTAVHHLANAIGTPTWTLVPSRPAWRYCQPAEVWYRATNRMFRQAEGEPWSAVMQRVAAALRIRGQLAEAAE